MVWVTNSLGRHMRWLRRLQHLRQSRLIGSALFTAAVAAACVAGVSGRAWVSFGSPWNLRCLQARRPAGAMLQQRQQPALAALRLDEPRAPPEPRSRRPRTERDVANDVVFGVVAVELLFNHDRLDMEVGNAFRRAVYEPVMDRLRVYCDSTTSEARNPAKSWRLQDRVLERQFSLSNFFTGEAGTDLGMIQAGRPMLPAAQVNCRKLLVNAGVEATDDPVSSALAAWMAHQLSVGEVELPTSECRTRPFGYAMEKPGVSEWLLPVFVEHDRSSHAERMALLSIGDVIKETGGKLHPDSKISGSVCVYATHTPCISCLAVFCQFKRRLPGVNLYFYYDTWGDNRRWIADSGIKQIVQEE